MGKIITFIFILFLGIIAYFAMLNWDTVSIVIAKGRIYEIPKVALVFLSAVTGAVFMLIVYIVRDTKRLIENIQTQRRQRKQEKIHSLYSRALSAIHSGKIEAAVDSLKDMLGEDSENIQALMRLGEIALGTKDLKKAQDYFKRALSVDPESVEVLLNLVKVKELIGSEEDALKYVDEILDRDSNNLTALYKKREILESLGRWDDIIYLQKDILNNVHTEIERDTEQQLLIGYEYESGRESLEAGNTEKAKKMFRTVLKLNSDFIPGHLGLAEVMTREGNTNDAINYLERMCQQHKSMILISRLEDLLLNIGEPSRLIGIYKKSLAERPTDNSLKFFLAKLYYRLEMLDDSLEIVQYIESPSLFPEVAKIKGGIYLKRGQAEMAAEEFKSVLNLKSSLRVPYYCSNCGYMDDNWSGRCPSCSLWNTYYFNLHGTCKVENIDKIK